jgi:Lectin C-type domain
MLILEFLKKIKSNCGNNHFTTHLLAPYLQNVEYWTSGNNLGCDNQLRWCSAKNNDYAKESLNWNQPKNKNSCVSIVLENANSGDPQLRTVPCETKKRFICEVIATFQKGSCGSASSATLKVLLFMFVKSKVVYPNFEYNKQVWLQEDQYKFL